MSRPPQRAVPRQGGTNGKDALKIAFSVDPPDLILLAIMMPEMDGFTRLQSSEKTIPKTADIPVIFLTA
jgi:putative two-component system response regulator